MPVLAVVAVAATVAGAGISAYSSYQQGQQADRMAQYNATVQRNNAQVNEQMQIRQAQSQSQIYDQQQNAIRQQQSANLAQSQEQIRRTEIEKAQMQSKQRAAYASAGVVMTGTPLAVLSDTESKYRTVEADTLYKTEVQNHALNYEYNSADYRKSLLSMDVYGAKAGAKIANDYAGLTEMQGKSAALAGNYSAAGTLLSGAGQAAGQYTNYKQLGAI